MLDDSKLILCMNVTTRPMTVVNAQTVDLRQRVQCFIAQTRLNNRQILETGVHQSDDIADAIVGQQIAGLLTHVLRALVTAEIQ